MAKGAAQEALERSRKDALNLAAKVGAKRVREHLERAERDLLIRLGGISPDGATFTEARMQATLVQIRDVLRGLQPGLRSAVVDTGVEAADRAGGDAIAYLERAERQFRGIGAQPLAIDEASVLDRAKEGAKSSLLRRLVSGEGIPASQEVAKKGILDRYGVAVIGHFEQELRTGIVARKPWADVRTAITGRSPFLQGAPGHWAERIVRTETAGAYGRASLEAHQELDEQLDDLVGILCATFDDRTGPDSSNVHGEVRKPGQAFEYVAYDGSRSGFTNPPNRPNDREIVVAHRISWPVPPGLVPLGDGEVRGAYVKAKQKFHGRPRVMSTVRGLTYG